VQSGSLTLTGLNTFAGSSQVLSGAVLQLDGQINNTTLDVASGATLMGSGTILGTTTIAGLHRPGNSPGIQTLGNLTYTSGASVQWELWNNTILNNTTPPDYDQIVLTGNLDFAGATAFNLLFTGSSGPTNFSEVAWANSFWDTDREWLVYDVAGTTTGFGNLSLVQTNWLDSADVEFTTVRSMASFRLKKRVNNDVYLVYTSIPRAGVARLGRDRPRGRGLGGPPPIPLRSCREARGVSRGNPRSPITPRPADPQLTLRASKQSRPLPPRIPGGSRGMPRCEQRSRGGHRPVRASPIGVFCGFWWSRMSRWPRGDAFLALGIEGALDFFRSLPVVGRGLRWVRWISEFGLSRGGRAAWVSMRLS
jgi:hypothetical protein